MYNYWGQLRHVYYLEDGMDIITYVQVNNNSHAFLGFNNSMNKALLFWLFFFSFRKVLFSCINSRKSKIIQSLALFLMEYSL